MRNLSKTAIFLVFLSIFEKIESNWLSEYFFKKNIDTKEQNFESFYFSEIDPLSEENIEKYTKLLNIEEREEFLNNKLKQLYSLYKNNPKLISHEMLKNIRMKIQEGYQNVSPNLHILFYPALESFIIYPTYEDTRRKKELAQELVKEIEDLSKSQNQKCIELYKNAQQECEKLKHHVSNIKKQKLDELKRTKTGKHFSSNHTFKHIHPVHPVTHQEKSTINNDKKNNEENTSTLPKEYEESPLEAITLPTTTMRTHNTSVPKADTINHTNFTTNNTNQDVIKNLPVPLRSNQTI